MRGKKRKRFATVFCRKFFWITVVLAGLYLFGLYVFVQDNKDERWNGFWQVENTRLENIRETGSAEDFVRKQQFRGALMADANQVVSLLYDGETKEQIAGCEEQLVIMRSRSEEAPSTIYCYPTAQIPGWEEYRKKIAKLKKESNLVSENIQMTYFYQKGEDIVPGSFTVSVSVIDLFEYEIATNGYDPEHAFDYSFDMSEVIPEGYDQKEIGMGSFQFAPLIVGYSTTNPWMKYYGGIDRAKELLEEEYAAMQEGKDTDDMEARSFFTLTLKSYSQVELENGRTIVLLSVAHYDLWKTYRTIFLGIAGGLLLFDMLLALILAKLSYAQLKAHYRMEDYRKNLMNTMAHDLKSPLMSISGYAENLANNMAPDKQEHYANAILENVQYMNGIVESVLALSKTEQFGIRLNKEAVNPDDLLKEVQKRYELQMEEKALQVKTAGQLTLKADKGLMLQVLDNLLGNAVKYAIPNSVIQVLFENKYLQMQNACEEDLSDVADTLCEPFVLGSKSRSGKMGSGMGLAIVKNICELHGYRLRVAYEDGQFYAKISFSKK